MVRLSALGIAVALALATTPALAAERDRAPGDVARRWKVGGELELAYWKGAITWQEPDRIHLRTDAFGVAGWQRVPLSLGVAYAFDDHVLVGLRLDGTLDPRWSARVATLEGAVGPWVEILLPRTRDVRPFVMLRVALGGSRTLARNGHDPAVLETRGRASLYPLVAVGVGAHAFISEDLSFDATVALEHRWNFRVGSQVGQTDGTALEGAREFELRDTTLGVGLALGLSRWF